MSNLSKTIRAFIVSSGIASVPAMAGDGSSHYRSLANPDAAERLLGQKFSGPVVGKFKGYQINEEGKTDGYEAIRNMPDMDTCRTFGWRLTIAFAETSNGAYKTTNTCELGSSDPETKLRDLLDVDKRKKNLEEIDKILNGISPKRGLSL